MIGDSGFGLTSLCLAGIGGVLLGKWMSSWETAVDRHLVADELEKTVQGLQARCQTSGDHKELDEVLTGIADLRQGRIPFESREPGFFAQAVGGLKAKAGQLASRLNPWGARNGQPKKEAQTA